MSSNTFSICKFLSALTLVFLLQIGFNQDLFAAKKGNWLTVQLSVDPSSSDIKEVTVMLRLNKQWKSKHLTLPAKAASTVFTTDFDLGENQLVEVLKIIWPSSEHQIINAVAANQVLSISKPNFPVPPSNVFARVTDPEKIDLVWKDNSSNELGFTIERSLHAEKGFVEIGQVPADQNYFTDHSVEKNQTYYYRVRAISDVGLSLFDGAYQKTEENTGLVFEDLSQPLRMYPNPNRDFLDVRVNNEVMGHVLVKFLDDEGNELKTLKIKKQIKDLKTKVDISALPYGIYMVEISLVTYRSLLKAS